MKINGKIADAHGKFQCHIPRIDDRKSEKLCRSNGQVRAYQQALATHSLLDGWMIERDSVKKVVLFSHAIQEHVAPGTMQLPCPTAFENMLTHTQSLRSLSLSIFKGPNAVAAASVWIEKNTLTHSEPSQRDEEGLSSPFDLCATILSFESSVCLGL
jgi:tRNA-dihydrouridine synthase